MNRFKMKLMAFVAIFAGTLAGLFASPPAARADSGGEIISPPVIGSTIYDYTWRIDQPNVKVRKKGYPQIKFHPGDVLTVTVGGAVQTGGSGDTWKRYVDPSGDNSDRLYHGLIKIEGITNAFPPSLVGQEEGLVRMQSVLKHRTGKGTFRGTLTIPKHVTKAQETKLFLQLGYEDDGYGDNGYYSHDDGTEDQAKGVGSAFVIVSVRLPHPVNDPYVLKNSFNSKDAAVRRLAAQAVGALGKEAAWAAPLLNTAAKDSDAGVREEAAKALKLVGTAKDVGKLPGLKDVGKLPGLMK